VTLTGPTRIGGLAIAAALFVAACGGTGASTPPASDAAGAGSPGDGAVEGSILVTGSSTVEPISSGVAELFKDANPGFEYTVEGPGTGDGFQTFCAGEADIADASRAIRDEEKELCATEGVEYVELKIAIDGLSIITSVNNTALSCLSFADIYALVGPESTGFATWSDGTAIATELGSTTVLPDADLQITGPGEESGTFDSFVEIVLGAIAEERGQEETTRPDYTANANDSAIIEGIATSDTSLGWVGYAFAEENLDKVKLLGVAEDANGTCVEPTPATISSGEYPIARDLYIYVNEAKAAENPAVASFVDYYLAEGTIDTVLQTVPYVALTPEALAESRSAWDAR